MATVLKLDVGGTQFTTTVETLKACSKLYEKILVNTTETAFLDRDPDVFAKLLKLLRGYPCLHYMQDDDVLFELKYWNHESMTIPLPEWFATRMLTVHTLNPEQSGLYNETHGLLDKTVVKWLVDSNVLKGPIERFPLCKVVAAEEGWSDCVWVLNKDIADATTRFRFNFYFSSKQ